MPKKAKRAAKRTSRPVAAAPIQKRKAVRDPKTDLIVLVAIVAVFAMLIMFLRFPW